MTWSERRRDRIDKGLCPRCPGELEAGASLCVFCAARNRVVMRGITGCKKKTNGGPGRPKKNG